MTEPFTPSSALIAFGEYCKKQSEDDSLPDAEVSLWAQMADEIESYVDSGEQQPDLFEEGA
jgi:hypothetical protein